MAVEGGKIPMTAFTLFKHLTLVLALLQSDDYGVDVLEQDRLRALGGSPRNTIITIIAQHIDGTPARGTIACAGVWYKHRAEGRGEWAEAYPFNTDSRGAVVFNPLIDDDGLMDCTAVDTHLHSGTIRFPIEPRHRAILTVR